MDQLLLNIHPVPKKTMGNFIVGKNAECLNSIERLRTTGYIISVVPAQIL